jgi:hypothetical protein
MRIMTTPLAPIGEVRVWYLPAGFELITITNWCPTAAQFSGSHTIRIVQFTYPSGDILPRSSAEAGSAAMAWTFDTVPNCVTVGI